MKLNSISSKLCWFFLVFIISIGIYTSTLWLTGLKRPICNDILPATFTALSLVREGNFDLNEFTFLYQPNQIPYYLIQANEGRLISKAPPLGAVLALPIYKIAQWNDFFATHPGRDILFLEKISAAFITSVGIALTFLLFWELTQSRKKSLILTAVLGLATNVWATAASDLWQHTPLFLMNVLFLFLLVKSLKNEKLLVFMGMPLALATTARITSFVNLFIVLTYIAIKKRKYLAQSVLFIFIGLIPFFIFNYYHFGNPFISSYFKVAEYSPLPLIQKGVFLSVVVKGIASLFFAPSNGFLFYSPVLLLTLVGMYLIFKSKVSTKIPREIYLLLLILILAQILVLGTYGGLGGLYSWGSRFSVDFISFWVIFLIPVYDWMIRMRWRQFLASTLLFFSILVQVIGVYFYQGEWDNKFWAGADTTWSYEEDYEKDVAKFWSLKNGQLVFTIRHLLK